MKIKLLSSVLLLFGIQILYAQNIDSLMLSQNVEWIMTMETEYVLTPKSIKGKEINRSDQNVEQGDYSIEIMKSKPADSVQLGYTPTLSHFLYKDYKTGSLEIEGDLLSDETFDYYHNKMFFKTPGENIRSFNIEQVWYFENDKNKISNLVISITPIFRHTTRKKKGQQTPIVKLLNNHAHFLQNPAYESISYNILNFDNAIVLKGNPKEHLKTFTLYNVNKRRTPVFSVTSLPKKQREEKHLSKKRVKVLQTSKIDTFSFFSYTNYEEIVFIKKCPDIKDEPIIYYKIGQKWIYDVQNHQLVSQVYDIAPTRRIKFEDRIVLYKSLYYLRMYPD